jgi:hypothetical protein
MSILDVNTIRTNTWQNSSGVARRTVVQSVFQTFAGSSTVTNTANGQTLYGLTGGRIYGTLCTVTITPESVSNRLVCIGTAGFTSRSRSTTGAEGIVFLQNGATGYEMGNYPWYTGSVFMPSYQVDTSINWVITPTGTSQQTIQLLHYAYAESGTHSSTAIKASLVVMEVVQ